MLFYQIIYLKKYYLIYLMALITINDIEYNNSDDAKSKENKSYKYDKLLLKKSLMDTIPENDNSITFNDKSEVAPDIIHLENHKKFNDNGDIIIIIVINIIVLTTLMVLILR